jgi:hypothetical protein
MAEPERWVNVYWDKRDGVRIGYMCLSEAEAKEDIDFNDSYQTTIKLK